MKPLLSVLLTAVLAVGFVGQADACFEVGGLTVSVYKSDGAEAGYEPGVDLATADLSGGITLTIDKSAFEPAVTWDELQAGAFGYSGITDNKVFFVTTEPTAPSVVKQSWGAFLAGDDGAKAYYRAGAVSPAEGLASDFSSYFIKMDSGTTPGQYAGLNAGYPDGFLHGEANLGPLGSGGSVTLYIYKYERVGRDVFLVPGAGGDYQGTLTLVTGGTVLTSPVINDISNQNATEGTAYGYTPTLAQGTPPFVWSLVDAPAGMTINASTGAISWPAPVQAGSPHTVTVAVENDTLCDDTATYQITVQPGQQEWAAAEPASTLGESATTSNPLNYLAFLLAPVGVLFALRRLRRNG